MALAEVVSAEGDTAGATRHLTEALPRVQTLQLPRYVERIEALLPGG